MRRALTALALLPLLAFTAHADLSGAYGVSGTNPDGSDYTGTLEVIRHDGVYQFSWAVGDAQEGIGMEADHSVAVGYGGEGCGVVLYRVDSGGELQGRWALYGASDPGTETAVQTSGGSLAGTYDVQGTNPDGTPYTGTLAIEANGDTYSVTWNAGGTYVGVGLLDGDTFATSYGGEACGVALYRMQGTGLSGWWAPYGSPAVGTETATRD